MHSKTVSPMGSNLPYQKGVSTNIMIVVLVVVSSDEINAHTVY